MPAPKRFVLYLFNLSGKASIKCQKLNHKLCLRLWPDPGKFHGQNFAKLSQGPLAI